MKEIKRYFFVILVFSLLFFMGCSTTIPTNQIPTINSIPLTVTLLGEPYSYEVEATDADGDDLTYSLTLNPSGMVINSSTGVISWTPTMEGDYNVSLKVSDGDSFDTQSFTLTVSGNITEIIPSPPKNVNASDTYRGEVQITWDSVSNATHYQVYRADSLIGQKIPISSWQIGTTYDDTTAEPGITYWYWVRAGFTTSSTDYISEYSDYDTGSSLGFI
jgi:hypothetical protein